MTELDRLISDLEEAVLCYDGYPIPEAAMRLGQARDALKAYVNRLQVAACRLGDTG